VTGSLLYRIQFNVFILVRRLIGTLIFGVLLWLILPSPYGYSTSTYLWVENRLVAIFLSSAVLAFFLSYVAMLCIPFFDTKRFEVYETGIQFTDVIPAQFITWSEFTEYSQYWGRIGYIYGMVKLEVTGKAVFQIGDKKTIKIYPVHRDYAAIANYIALKITPTIAQRHLDMIQTGGKANYGTLRVDRTHVQYKSRQYKWDQIESITQIDPQWNRVGGVYLVIRGNARPLLLDLRKIKMVHVAITVIATILSRRDRSD
jgi:hypothetical protein